MSFAQYPPDPDQQEGRAQDLDDILVIVANISAFAVLLLVTISCICCVKRRPLQGRSEYGSYGHTLDHVPLEDLLSKPPLADPESVFSEASYDDRLSVHTTSRMTLISDGSGGSHDYLSPPQQGSDRNESSHHNASFKAHYPGDAPAHFNSARKWSSEKLKVSRAARPTRGQEKEAQRHSVQPDLIPLPTIPDDRSETSSLQSPETVSTQNPASNLTPETAKKQKSSKLPFESPTLERTGLKIHRDSIKPECYTLSSSTRCSFSHELGHVAHGNKIPRTSLPRTEEGEDVKCKTDSNGSSAANIPCHIKSGPAPDVGTSNTTVNGGSSLDKTGVDATHLSKSQRDHVISYDKLEHEYDSRPVNTITGGNQKNVATPSNANTASTSRIVLPTSISIDGSLPTLCSSTVEDIHRDTSSCGGESEGAALRRSFSFVNSQLPNGGRGTSKTFSLNLKINFHFGNEKDDPDVSRDGCATVPRAGCATIEECGLPSVKAGHASQSLASRVANPDICGKPRAGDKNKTDLEGMCQDKVFEDNTQNINSQPIADRERLSEPIASEGETAVRHSDRQSASRRFSSAESPTGRGRSATNQDNLPNSDVRGSSFKTLPEQRMKESRADNAERGVCNEVKKDENMNTISDAVANASFEQRTGRAPSDDSLDLNTKSITTESDSISSDAESTGSRKSATKLQRTKAIIVDSKSPQLRRPVVTKKKASIESCEANLRNAPAPASPVLMDMETDPGRSTKNETSERTNSSESSRNKSASNVSAHAVDGGSRGGDEVKGACTRRTAHENSTPNQHNVVPLQTAEDNMSPKSKFIGSIVEKAKLSRTKDVESAHRQQENSSENRRKAMFFTPIDAREETPEVGDNFNSQTQVDHADQDNAKSKSYKPVALPRRNNPPPTKDEGQVIKTELHKSMSDSAAGYRSAEMKDTTRSSTLPSRGNSLIPVVIVDDETDDTASSCDDEDHNELPGAVSPGKLRNKNLDASDDSDYDNPWDNLDDAVKRASIRYNRRPSRLAAGTKTLLLKSAEDLGRLLEEAEKRRRLRSDGSHGEMLSPEEDDSDPPIIPFTRFSPYRHTVKGIVSETNMAAFHSTEDILKNSRQDYTRLSLLRKDAAKEVLNKGAEPRRPQSMTSKLKTIISSPETKHRKN